MLEIIQEYTEDTLRALRRMGKYKAPGLDEYQAIFFKNTWSGAAVHSFMKGILEGGDIPVEAAEALLVLTPKEVKPSTMKEFRPLSLCNIVYKLVSKIIVSRLREAWKSFISPQQASFVPGRPSIDNVILCQKFVHSMRFMKLRKGSVVIKLDLEKAYDILEWDFINETMRDADHA